MKIKKTALNGNNLYKRDLKRKKDGKRLLPPPPMKPTSKIMVYYRQHPKLAEKQQDIKNGGQ